MYFQKFETHNNELEYFMAEIEYVLKNFKYEGRTFADITIKDIYDRIKPYGDVRLNSEQDKIKIYIHDTTYEVTENTIKYLLS